MLPSLSSRSLLVVTLALLVSLPSICMCLQSSYLEAFMGSDLPCDGPLVTSEP